MKITIAQLNTVSGDIEGNLKKALRVLSEFGNRSDLIVFSELFTPPTSFGISFKHVQSAVHKLLEISKEYPLAALLLKVPITHEKGQAFDKKSSILLMHHGKFLNAREKKSSDKNKTLTSECLDFSSVNTIIPFKGYSLNVFDGEDLLSFEKLKSREKKNSLFIGIAEFLFNVKEMNSPRTLIQKYAEEYAAPFILVNRAGAEDGSVFDGGSICVNKKGEVVSAFPFFEEHAETIDITRAAPPKRLLPREKIAAVYDALVAGTRDYVKKNGFSKVIMGLSGGIDSAVTCVLAKEAFGAKNVLTLALPSKYSSPESEAYARRLAKSLNIRIETVNISDIFDSYERTLKTFLKTEKNGDVEIYLQNIQARTRGNILMAFSNKLGYIVLATGNKSELLTGYCTLYGDMAGGFAPLADVTKTMVYELAGYINRQDEIIPEEIIKRSPTAELSPNQTDQDTLPPYDTLDKILCYFEEGYSCEEIEKKNFDIKTVRWVQQRVRNSGYKIEQASLCVKLSI